MAISSYKTFLMKGSGTSSTTYTKLIDIIDCPDLGGAPEMLDITTLSDPMTASIPGIQTLGALTFNANYTSDDFDTLLELKDIETPYAVWLGGTESAGVVTPTGSEGKFEFKGRLDVYKAGAGVNEVQKMVITIAATTPITKAST